MKRNDRDVPLSVVIVDDDLDTVDSTATLLRIHGCEVRTADNGVDALALIATRCPDIVMADLAMPRMDGFDLARRVIAMCDGERFPVLIAVSGLARAVDQEKASEAGFHVHLTKPVELDILFGIIDWFRTIH